MEKVAIIGATGPAGLHLARILKHDGLDVRLVARRVAALEAVSSATGGEWRAGDARDVNSLLAATAGCDWLVDCIGLPASQMHEHPLTARSISQVMRRRRIPALQVSSYWSYLPATRLPIDETHPRSGGSRAVQLRREAEDILLDAGATVAQLPDFFGPDVHVSSLQQPLAEAAAGKPMPWVGGADIAREYAYLPDAMRAVARLLGRADTAGERFIVPGSGPLTGRETAAIASRHLGREVKLRTAGPTLLKLLSLVMADLRSFLPMVPYYVAPIAFDGTKLERVIGPITRTDYEAAVAQTIDWLRAQASAVR
jgi:nucleoside-diphosphate-sugar epimerase